MANKLELDIGELVGEIEHTRKNEMARRKDLMREVGTAISAVAKAMLPFEYALEAKPEKIGGGVTTTWKDTQGWTLRFHFGLPDVSCIIKTKNHKDVLEITWKEPFAMTVPRYGESALSESRFFHGETEERYYPRRAYLDGKLCQGGDYITEGNLNQKNAVAYVSDRPEDLMLAGNFLNLIHEATAQRGEPTLTKRLHGFFVQILHENIR